jgi:type IV secretory pathway TraG/TraD family ATPase VirD4
MRMPASHQALLVNGAGPFICQRPNYLSDALFKGRYDNNPMYAKQGRAVKEASPAR